jgi:hypothetical protein
MINTISLFNFDPDSIFSRQLFPMTVNSNISSGCFINKPTKDLFLSFLKH